MTAETKLSAHFLTILERVGDVALENVWDVVDRETGRKNVLNLRKLVKSLARNIFVLSKGDVTLSADDADKISGFLNNLAIAVGKFCDFLDYDGDGVVELVSRNDKNEIVEGEDIKLMLDDGKAVVSSFKKHGDLQSTILAIISSLVAYFTSDQITQTREDFDGFKTACEASYESMKLIKTIDHAKLFNENADDLMRFIITLCVVIVPVVELVSGRIAQINGTKDETLDVSVSSDDIRKAVADMYGIGLEFILSTVESLVKVFLKSVKASSAGSKFTDFLKRKCCCGASTAVNP